MAWITSKAERIALFALKGRRPALRRRPLPCRPLVRELLEGW